MIKAAHYVHICWLTNALFLLVVATVFFLYPIFFTLRHLGDPALKNGGMPRAAVELHQKLSPRYKSWARERVQSQNAASLTTEDLIETEWPVFGSMFYLWATESLQAAWEADNSLSEIAPNVYARDAIAAATTLILDPNHAKWVRDHWGENYLHHENVFYRGLLVSAITTHHNLTGDASRLGELRGYVENLANEIDESPAGLLEDYPGECYPGDVIMVIAAIQRADAVLGTDHSEFIQRALRGFIGEALTQQGIPPYMASVRTGIPHEPARGCANSYICTIAPDIWPEPAAGWYSNYEKHFWQERWGMHAFREYPHGDTERDFDYRDMDAGPVFMGFGTAAAAFGLAAAKANGRYDHAYPLAAQMLAGAWVLPEGTMLAPRLMSSMVHAPYLGEACILYNLTRQTPARVSIQGGGMLPGSVWVLLSLYAIGFLLLCAGAVSLVWRTYRKARYTTPLPAQQAALWAVCVVVSGVCFLLAHYAVAFLCLFVAFALPISRVPKQAKAKKSALPLYCGLV